MKTTLTLLTATVMPGGFIILGVALIGYWLTRRTAGAPIPPAH